MAELRKLIDQRQKTIVLEEVTEAFETIASIQLRQIKDRVIASREFFHELWGMYSQFRIAPRDRFQTITQNIQTNKEVVVVVSSEQSLSGGIDQRLIEQLLNDINPTLVDLVVIGHHGAQLLNGLGIRPVQVYPLPDITKKIDVVPIIKLISSYKRSSVYYQSFVSLTTQRIGHFELLFAVQKLSEHEQKRNLEELIYSSDYIFEPSFEEVVGYMESMMLSTALTEVILESRLAQLASRFGAMNRARLEAHSQTKVLSQLISRTRRFTQDESMRSFHRQRSGV
jgi:ATP synthase F1 gamma subunit